MTESAKVEDIKQGEYVKRKPDAKKVYIRQEYDRESKTYWLQDAEDIGRGISVKKGTVLYIGFEY